MASLYDHEAEAAVLGCVLEDARCLDLAQALAPADFHHPRHALVWEACLELHAEKRPLDHLTLAERLKARGALEQVGGAAFLMGLDQGVPVTANAAAYVEIVLDRSARRAIVQRARDAAQRAADLNLPAEQVALEASAEFAQVGSSGAARLRTMREVMLEVMDDLDAIAKGTRKAAVPTGIDVWDELIGGLQRGVLTMIGAQPSVGKSALLGAMVEGVGSAGTRCGVFSLEDPAKWLPKRLLSKLSSVPVKRLSTERLPEWALEGVASAAERIFQWAGNVVLDDRSGLMGGQVAATARQMVVQMGCEAIFVDHLGELGLDDEWGRHDLAVHKALQGLRNVAKDLEVPVVVLAHFHRPKGNTDKEPRHLRPTSAMWANSGGVEKMARVAAGLWEDPELPGGVVATVLKQTEGEKDLDFWMPMQKACGLIAHKGGYKRDGDKGYSEFDGHQAAAGGAR